MTTYMVRDALVGPRKLLMQITPITYLMQKFGPLPKREVSTAEFSSPLSLETLIFIKAANFDQRVISYDSDAFSIEEKGEVKLDALPWSDTSNSTTDICLPPHPCNTECWHKDPVEVAARRYESAGRFQDASKLRMDFRGLSILHRRILQWYRWAEGQWALKGVS